MSGDDSMSAGNKSTSNEQHDTFFGEVDVDLAQIGNPRAEKFPNAGPFPWLDRPDAEAEVSKRLKAETIGAIEADQLRHWIRNGYLILDRALKPELLDEVWDAYQKAIDSGVIQIPPEQTAPDDP